MDNSAELPTNAIDEVNMGNILSNSNENNGKTSDTETDTMKATNENLEVKNPPNLTENAITSSIEIVNSESSKIHNIDAKLPEKCSSSEENIDMWLDGKTSELVKNDNEEDFDVIVKSLETAIVETEHYDNESKKDVSPVATKESEVLLDDSPMASLVGMMDEDEPVLQATNETSVPEPDSIETIENKTNVDELLNSSIVSPSIDDNEEVILLNTTVESSESDFTLQLDEEPEIAVPSADNTNNISEIKIVSVTSIVDYDDSSEEEIEQEKITEAPKEIQAEVNTKENEIITEEKENEEQNLEIKNVAEKIIMSVEDSEEKPRAPPKKIKLIRQKLPTPVKEENEKTKEAEQSKVIEAKTSNETSYKKPEEKEEDKPDSKLEESFESDEKLFSEIFKIEDEVENKPVKTQKLKLKRNYVTPPVVSKPQVLHTSVAAKVAEVATKTPVKFVESVKEPVVEPVKETKPPEVPIKTTEESDKSTEIIVPIEEPTKINEVIEESIKDPVEIVKSVEESPKIMEEPIKIDPEPIKEPVEINVPVEESIKNDLPVEELNKVETSIEDSPLIETPVEESITIEEEPAKIISPVEEVVEVAAPIEESIETALPPLESVKIDTPLEESPKIDVCVEEPINNSVSVEKSVEESAKIETLVKESVKIDTPVEESAEIEIPVEKSVKIDTLVEESAKIEIPIEEFVKIDTPVEESAKIEIPVKESVKIDTPVEESAKIEIPVEESAKIEIPVEESVKIDTPVEESAKIEIPVEESAKIEIPVEESAKIETPVEESAKIETPVEESAKFETPVEESVKESIKNETPVEESIKINLPVEESVEKAIHFEESVKIETPVEDAPIEESPKIDISIEEPIEIPCIVEEESVKIRPAQEELIIHSESIIEAAVKSIEINEEPAELSQIEEIAVENADPAIEAAVKSIEIPEECNKVEETFEELAKTQEQANFEEEQLKIVSQTDEAVNSIIGMLGPTETPEDNINIETQIEHFTNIEMQENKSPIAISIEQVEQENQLKDIDETDRMAQEVQSATNIIEATLIAETSNNTVEFTKEMIEEPITEGENVEIATIKTLEPTELIEEPIKVKTPELEKNEASETIEKEEVPETNLQIENNLNIIPEAITEMQNVGTEAKPINTPEKKKELIETPIPVIESLPEKIEEAASKILISEPITIPEKDDIVEEEKVEPPPKKPEEIQFPLLMSRLQDKLHSHPPKTGRNVARPFAPQQQQQQLPQQPTIEPETSNQKLRAMKRKHEAEQPSRSITKPLTVEIDDLEGSDAMMQPGEHENIPKLVIKQIPKPEQRSSPKITIKPIKPPGSPDVSSKRSKMSEDSPTSSTTRLTIKPVVNKTDPLKITITKQKSDDTHSILKIYQPEEDLQYMDDTHVPKLTIKSIPKSEEMQHSPKITIKPVKPPGSPKVTVKPIIPPDNMEQRSHSPKVTVKPVINPEETYPKVTIKPVLKPEESHKVTQISPRQVKLKSMTFDSASGVTVEPICSSSMQGEHESPMKISVKPFAKMEDTSSPKLTIKPLTKTCEIVQSEDGTANPLKLTIKPILKPEESYQSPKITIKPIVKHDDYGQQQQQQQQQYQSEESDKPERIILKIQKTNLASPKERTSSHVRKEPEVKIEAIPPAYNPEQNQKLDKIKLKLTKEGSHAQIIPSITTSHALTETNTSFSLKRTIPITNSGVPEKRQKSELTELLHSSDISINIVEPHSRQNVKQISEEVTIMKIDKTSSNNPSVEGMTQMRLKEMLLKISQKSEITCTPHVKQVPQQDDSSSSDDVRIVEVMEDPLRDPLNEDSSSQDVLIINEVIDTNPFKNVQIINAQTIVEPTVHQQQQQLQQQLQQQQQPQFTPKKRGRPRKVPLEVRPEIKGEDCVLPDLNTSVGESPEGGRPKRTCRAPAGRTPFAVKERKPRGSGRGRGSTRGVRGAKALTPQKLPKEPKTPRGKALKVAKALAKLEAAKLAQEVLIDEITIEDTTTNDTTNANANANTNISTSEETFLKKPEISVVQQMVDKISESGERGEIVADVKNTSSSSSMSDIKNTPVNVYEEETRMSASENNSRAQTPARQVFIVPLSAEGPEESQSSVQSSATTESTKNKKGRLEICDPDSAHTTVEQIVEYAWGNGGPYMLQEQIAQFLGVKSFKRKYPGLTRRPVDMQERDYIKEKGLVSESMCDMGLTAVPSSEILDIMYSDFQEKYEEYRKCLRDKQSKEISNKQKAISLATSQEKNKIDFKERAIRSTANWNATFNKTRKETRKCCMDLQTFTVNYPTGKNYPRVPHKNPVGSYPIALVPGQFTDYYKAYSPHELNYLPLNTVRYGPILPNQRCLEASDGSSESDSSSGSDSDSSDESMSTDDEAPSTPLPVSKHLTPLLSNTPKTKVH